MCSTVQLDDLTSNTEARAHVESNSSARVRTRTFRAGLARPKPDGPRTRPFRQKNFAMGRPKANADKALALAARLGDEETARTLFSPRMKSLFSAS